LVVACFAHVRIAQIELAKRESASRSLLICSRPSPGHKSPPPPLLHGVHAHEELASPAAAESAEVSRAEERDPSGLAVVRN
jgi:hypothetical protein